MENNYKKLDIIVSNSLKEIYETSDKSEKIVLTNFDINNPEDLCIFEIAKIAENIWGFPIYIRDLNFINKKKLKNKTDTKRKIMKATKAILKKHKVIDCKFLREKVKQNLSELKVDTVKDFTNIYNTYYKK